MLLVGGHLDVFDAAGNLGSAKPHTFLLDQVVLLGAQDATRAHDADPPYEVGSGELEMLHCVDADQGACAAQTSLAMDCDGARFCLRDAQELTDNGVGGRGPINEEKVGVVDAVALEFRLFILWFVEPDHVGDPEVFENLDVVFWSVSPLWLPRLRVNRPHERDELVWNNPIKITVFHLLVVLVLLVVKLSENVPAQAYRKLKALQAVENRALVSTRVSIARIAEGPKLRVIGLKCLPNDLSRQLEHDHHEGAHKEARVGLLVVLGAGIVEKFHILVAFVGQQATQFAHVFVRTCYVERAEVLVKWLID